jgi:aminomethyltransferase
MAHTATGTPLKRTPLHALHLRLGARMVGFAGYDMPVQYPTGIIREHQHTRAAAGLFDVSHMGQIRLIPRSGIVADAARALETLVPADIVGLAHGKQRYALFTDDGGGILDDLMVSHQDGHLFLVVNASRKHADEAHLRAHLAPCCLVEPVTDRALIALQGPMAEDTLVGFAPEVRTMHFMDARELRLMGQPCLVSRSGYTGEDGFEISLPAPLAIGFCTVLLQNPLVAPIGLGARDSLRLEAGLCLYGSDLDEATTPVEAGLGWSIGKARRLEGARAGGFPGSATILEQLVDGSMYRRVGLKPEGRAPVREGAVLYKTEDGAEPAGNVTSGGFGVTIGMPIAMGYVETGLAELGTRLFAEVRGKRLPVKVAKLPFVPARFKR